MTSTLVGSAGTQRVVTPTVGKAFKRSLFWIGAFLFIVLVGLTTIGIIGNGVDGQPLSSTNAAPGGAMGVAEVLKQQGVTVTATDSLKLTRDAITDPAQTTLLIYDDSSYLDADQLREAVSLADNVVLIDPTFGMLRAVAPGVASAGAVKGTLRADCAVPGVKKAEKVSGGGFGYRVIDTGLDAVTCLGSGDRVYSLIQVGSLTILGATDALTNEHVIENGNAALALNLLGSTRDLVWYLPSARDLPPAETVDPGSLTPAWVTPTLVLLVITFIVAAIWRGRRLGPLVIENLPVTVRASETMLGRARLYEKSNSRLRAVDSLRIGAIGRLAGLCGLPRAATVEEVVAAVAGVTGRQIAEVRGLLVEGIPQSDRDLISISDALLVLEHDVTTALRQ